MAVVDASVWISWFKRDDKFHKQAKSIFQAIALDKEKIDIPVIAFTEVAGVMKRTTKNDNAARRAVYYMKDMELNIFVDLAKLEPIATEIAVKYSVRGADAYYLAAAELTKSTLYTFDIQQSEAFDVMSKTW